MPAKKRGTEKQKRERYQHLFWVVLILLFLSIVLIVSLVAYIKNVQNEVQIEEVDEKVGGVEMGMKEMGEHMDTMREGFDKKIGALEESVKSEEWSLHELNGYVFGYPASWSIQETSDGSATFGTFTKNGVEMASYACPSPGIGLEAWTFQKSYRELESAQGKINIELWIGQPYEDPELGSKNVVIIRPDVSEKSFDCAFISNQEIDKEFQQMFHSIRSK